MSNFEEKELEILRAAVDKAQEKAARSLTHSQEVQNIIRIVERFLRKKRLVCYGGTAINNILPVNDQFYDKDIEIPDYDFFSADALNDAKKLADIYLEEGYTEIEAKAGVHHGTYKVFVNFIPVADITYIPKDLFKAIQNKGIKVNGIYYAPPDYLRMAMYLELSRPKGDVSRWEKVMKRLTLLNKHYPMKNPKCDHMNFMRSFEGTQEDARNIYSTVKDTAIQQGLVFFGGYASKVYNKYMPKKKRIQYKDKQPDFDLLSEDPETSVNIIKERLRDEGFKNVKIYKKPGFGEIIAPHYEITIEEDTVAFVYKPLACHSYNIIKSKGRTIKVATIDTMLSIYLAFLYADRPYYEHDRIYCMAQYLFHVQTANRLQQKGPLKRFSLQCIGKQETLEDMRNDKTQKYEELKNKRDTREYEEWFLKYVPSKSKENSETKSKPKSKTKSKTKSKPKSKPKSKTRKMDTSKKKTYKLIGLNM